MTVYDSAVQLGDRFVGAVAYVVGDSRREQAQDWIVDKYRNRPYLLVRMPC